MAAVTEYKGARIIHLFETKEVKRAVVSFDENEKLFFEGGSFAVDLLTNSWKYGTEFQLIYYTREKPKKIVERVPGHNGYYRVEVTFRPEVGAEMVRALKE